MLLNLKHKGHRVFYGVMPLSGVMEQSIGVESNFGVLHLQMPDVS